MPCPPRLPRARRPPRRSFAGRPRASPRAPREAARARSRAARGTRPSLPASPSTALRCHGTEALLELDCAQALDGDDLVSRAVPGDDRHVPSAQAERRREHADDRVVRASAFGWLGHPDLPRRSVPADEPGPGRSWYYAELDPRAAHTLQSTRGRAPSSFAPVEIGRARPRDPLEDRLRRV